ncbi:MAG TPA: ATP-binding protein [Streptosporangiaceae bacterium]|nr:ATP-binding protein [Streptosporangiaceae bacterium]
MVTNMAGQAQPRSSPAVLTLKHAGATAATVELCYDGDGLSLEVTDDGRGARGVPAASATHVGGHGIIGMRERVAMTGGSIHVGPQPAGGFAVRATLPVGGG